MWVETYGYKENEACIFVSGAGANSSFWSEWLCTELVNEGFFVIKYDHRDFGYSTRNEYDINPFDVKYNEETNKNIYVVAERL